MSLTHCWARQVSTLYSKSVGFMHLPMKKTFGFCWQSDTRITQVHVYFMWPFFLSWELHVFIRINGNNFTPLFLYFVLGVSIFCQFLSLIREGMVNIVFPINININLNLNLNLNQDWKTVYKRYGFKTW